MAVTRGYTALSNMSYPICLIHTSLKTSHCGCTRGYDPDDFLTEVLTCATGWIFATFGQNKASHLLHFQALC